MLPLAGGGLLPDTGCCSGAIEGDLGAGGGLATADAEVVKIGSRMKRLWSSKVDVAGVGGNSFWPGGPLRRFGVGLDLTVARSGVEACLPKREGGLEVERDRPLVNMGSLGGREGSIF